MSTQEINERVEKTFARVFGQRTPFAADLSRVSEPKWTSLKHIEFLVGLEREFGVRFDGSDATDMTSIPIVVERVRAKLA